ncbi:MAG: MarR family transcriptional regulator [Sphingopyxis sp.]|uniref:helix-turn-helix domain-containing protein n=1 Tax=Sphingopyxis sp. TaxID=1908224 RepID=UPI001A62BBE8|nr:helix-turn-helix domain-containing protein [Sphingopyxis sp.]MBL9068269.1 MarR family transcriptional regulator [Sphingopyxis sp.]
MSNDHQSRGLGTLLRHLIDLLDGDVAAAYAAAGLADYRPRFTPVVRALDEQDPLSVGGIAQYAGISHSAASQTVAEMVRRGLVERCKGRDGRQAMIRKSDRLVALLPTLRRHWATANRAEAALNAELSHSLRALVVETIETLERQSFLERIAAESDQGDAETPSKRGDV